MSRGSTRCRSVLGAAAALALSLPAQAQSPQVRVTLKPNVAALGEPVTYRVEVIGWLANPVTWMDPDTGSALTWGPPRAGVSRGHPRRRDRFGPGARSPRMEEATTDTVWIERRLQAFELGSVPVPGLRFRYSPPNSTGGATAVGQAPIIRLVVMPMLSAADSNATLRPVHGPLAAPWWERIPWRWIAVALVALALAILLWRALRRRKPVAPPVVVQPTRSAAAIALESLAALRALKLPDQGRFAEHAFRLGQILRHYLEATWPATRPGDTTPELVRHLGEAGLSDEDLKRLAGLLRVWDRVKFAREPFTADEAHRAETAVEGFVRRATTTPSQEAA